MSSVRRDLLAFGPFVLDAEDGALRRGDELVRLPPKAADVLILLAEADGGLVHSDTLREKVWKLEEVGTANVNFQIREIRKALGDGFIETVPRRGFRLTVPVLRTPKRGERDAQSPSAPPTIAPHAIANDRGRLWPAVGVAVLCVVALVGFAASRPAAPLRIIESVQITHDGSPYVGPPLETDGVRVFYRRIPDARFVSTPVSGGETNVVFDAASHFDLTDPGPASQALVIKSAANGAEGELWAVTKASGIPHRIGTLTAIEAKWSPDGERLALVTEGQLVFADADGKNLVRVTTPRRGYVLFPRWSPDGSKIRFTVNEPSDAMTPASNIWEVGREGGEPRLALPDWNPSIGTCCGVWTPDGKHFVFQANRGDRRIDLWALTEPRGLDRWLRRPARVTALTAGPLSLSGPAISPDGRTLFAVGALQQGQLVRWDRESRTFVPYLGGISGTWISFSPDGQSVAYVGYPDRKLWRSRLDGNDRRALVDGDFDLDGVAWSPDGNWIAFRSRMAGRRMKIFLVPASGGESHAITPDDRDQGIPAWSGDGRQIVFGDVPKRFGVPDGGEVLHLYDVETKAFSTVPGSENLWTARWSPDGRYISALTIDNEQRMKLYDTHSNRWQTTNAVHVDNPSWSRDSRSVYYDTEGEIIALRRLDVAHDTVREISEVKFLLAVYGWSGLSPADEPLILKNLTSPAVYALTIDSRR